MAQPISQDGQIPLPTEAATLALGARIAAALGPGDVICLYGDLGAGKTTLARGLIAALCADAGEVPSPTYTLVQTYRAGGFDVWHVDLYRLEGEDESAELGLEDAFDAHVSVIEWPERLGRRLPPDRLEVHLAETDDGGRVARLIGQGAWRGRIDEL
ncbi:MAG: tRNA (adenosine(37)-N6)-threonylcarbamoyltransferase complex ATPase subunit type 1 TsaE [Maricaulaceae bacterium]|jgi:tRNA threonylcarbamoyl adenosine modification protein YjeE